MWVTAPRGKCYGRPRRDRLREIALWPRPCPSSRNCRPPPRAQHSIRPELSFLQDIVDSALADLIESGDFPLAEKNRETLRHRLAIAAFQSAAAGERDATTLRRRMLDLFFAPSSGRPAAEATTSDLIV